VPQIAPEWATRYKFVIKPDKEGYDTVYSNLFFEDPETNSTYFLLEGENTRKVETGMRLIVKTDSGGPTQNCTYTTVLDKQAQQSDFLIIPSPTNPTVNIPIPTGVYMKLNANNFNTQFDELSVIAPGLKPNTAVVNGYPFLPYPMNIEDPAVPGNFLDYDVPVGSKIQLYFKFTRGNEGDTAQNCESRIYTLEKDLISTQNYANMQEWWNGDDVESILNSGTQFVSGIGNCPIDNIYIPTTTNNILDLPATTCVNFYRFFRNTTTNRLALIVFLPCELFCDHSL
jgi:hypothetical protein